MPAGRSSRCRACNSDHRAEIDRRLAEKQSPRKVSAWLQAQGERISHVGIDAHRANHLPVLREARERIAAAGTAALEAAVQKVVADVSLLDELAGYAMDAVRRLAPSMAKPTMPQAAAYAAAMKEGRELVKQREEILNPGGKNRTAPTAPEQRPVVNIIYASAGDQAQSPPEPGPSAPSAGQ